MLEKTWRSSCAIAATLLLLGSTAHAGVIVVLPGPGTPLQDAIDAASPGDTLRLGGGIFSGAVVIDKPSGTLHLVGTSRTDSGGWI